MRKTARQYLLLTYVCDLAKSMPGRDARDAIRPLFMKMGASAESREAFSEHLEKYIAANTCYLGRVRTPEDCLLLFEITPRKSLASWPWT